MSRQRGHPSPARALGGRWGEDRLGTEPVLSALQPSVCFGHHDAPGDKATGLLCCWIAGPPLVPLSRVFLAGPEAIDPLQGPVQCPVQCLAAR